MAEISIDQYPDIEWAKEVGTDPLNGDPIMGFGLVRVRTEDGIFDLVDGILVRTGRPTSLSSAYFGKDCMHPTARVVTTLNHPFKLAEFDRINTSGALVSEYLGIIDQLNMGRIILARSQRLLEDLRRVNREAPEVIEQIGILENTLKSQVSQSLPERAIEIAREFKTLDITEFGNAGHTSHGLWIPEWVINHFSKESKSA